MAAILLDRKVELFYHWQVVLASASAWLAKGQAVISAVAVKFCECPLAYVNVLRNNRSLRRGRSRLVQFDCSERVRAASRGPVYLGASHAGRVLAETRSRSHRMGRS